MAASARVGPPASAVAAAENSVCVPAHAAHNYPARAVAESRGTVGLTASVADEPVPAALALVDVDPYN